MLSVDLQMMKRLYKVGQLKLFLLKMRDFSIMVRATVLTRAKQDVGFIYLNAYNRNAKRKLLDCLLRSFENVQS